MASFSIGKPASNGLVTVLEMSPVINLPRVGGVSRRREGVTTRGTWCVHAYFTRVTV